MTPLDPPRWFNGPPMCPAATLPAFATREAFLSFHEANNPRGPVHRVWRCDDCGHWHIESGAPDPSGSTSGTGRSHKHESNQK